MLPRIQREVGNSHNIIVLQAMHDVAFEEAPELTPEQAERLARDMWLADCLNSFTYLPMVVEEMAEEEWSIRDPRWKDTPLEERRIWGKVSKGNRRMSLEGAALDFEPDPEFYLRYYEEHIKPEIDAKKRAPKEQT
jgi:hypothetical protein